MATKENELEKTKQHWEVLDAGEIEILDTPEWLWNKAKEYFGWCDDNPIISKKTMETGKNAGNKIINEHQRPYTLRGMCIHSGLTTEYFKDVRNINDPGSLVYKVVSRILYIIYVQNLELATVGIYNPVMISKLLNLEKDDTPSSPIKIEFVQGLPALANSENEILEKLNLEKAKIENDQEQNT